MGSTLVKSVRVAPELWALIEAEAERLGSSANAVLVEIIGAAFEGKVPAGLVVETPGRPMRISDNGTALKALETGLQLGPTTPKPGSRLKK